MLAWISQFARWSLKNLLQVHTKPVVTQVWKEKLCNKNIDIGFQSTGFHLCQWALVPLLCDNRAQIQRPLFRARENPAQHFLQLQFFWYYGQFSSPILGYEEVKTIKLLSVSNWIWPIQSVVNSSHQHSIFWENTCYRCNKCKVPSL